MHLMNINFEFSIRTATFVVILFNKTYFKFLSKGKGRSARQAKHGIPPLLYIPDLSLKGLGAAANRSLLFSKNKNDKFERKNVLLVRITSFI